MTTTRQVLDTVRSKVVSALEGLTFGGQPAAVGSGWPPVNVIEDAMRAGQVVMSVYDRSGGQDRTRWAPFPIAEVNPAPTCTATIDQTPIQIGGVAHVTIAGSPSLNDGVGIVLAKRKTVAGQAVIAGASDTFATLASALAAAINADSVLSTWVTASASAGVITLTNISDAQLPCVLNVANVATQTIEYKRTKRSMQIVAWCPSETVRQQATDPVDFTFSRLRSQFGFQINGEWIRCEYEGDAYIEEQQLQDTFRRDFFLSCEYGITGTQSAYPVLVNPASLTLLVGEQNVPTPA